jgi:molybdenum-dependent DNA-binding transcriptional regulator ModE
MLAPRDLPLLPVFVAVATAGSFTAAGRELGLAKSVVSQHIGTLEERCGVRLLERSTRRLSLTQVGAQVLDAANEVLASVRSLEQIVEGHHEVPTGTVRVTLPIDPALLAMISPLVAALARQYESLKVELNFDDAIHDLVAEGLDVAIRLGLLRESSYVVHKLGPEDDQPCRARRTRVGRFTSPAGGRAVGGALGAGLTIVLDLPVAKRAQSSDRGQRGLFHEQRALHPRLTPSRRRLRRDPDPYGAERREKKAACVMPARSGFTTASLCTRCFQHVTHPRAYAHCWPPSVTSPRLLGSTPSAAVSRMIPAEFCLVRS